MKILSGNFDNFQVSEKLSAASGGRRSFHLSASPPPPRPRSSAEVTVEKTLEDLNRNQFNKT
jgi:hypothetical protein